jgi:[ribosomal protein S18]-alanine N-acetyltransferase
MSSREACEIRAMVEGDLDDLVRLAAGSGEGPRWDRREYDQVLRSMPPFLRCGLVAEVQNELVGFAVASYLLQESDAEVEGLVVAPAHRRRGVGSALVQGCMTWAAKNGASAIRLEVRASNEPAIALYRGLGFRPAGVRTAYFSAPREDALLLAASIIPQGSGRRHGA